MLTRVSLMTKARSTLRTAGHWTVTLLVGAALALVSLINTVMVSMTHTGVYGPDATLTDLGTLRTMLASASVVTLFWWRDRPIVPVIGGLAAVLLAQFDYSVLFFGLICWVLQSTSARRDVVTGIGLFAIVGVSVRDVLRPAREDEAIPFWREMTPTGRTIAFIVIAVACIATIVGLRLYARLRGVKDATQERADAQSERNAHLEDALVRQGEREVLAREVHDALAHRLSLISLQSGSLEDAVNSSDPQVAATAKALRESANASLDDLRSLLRSLREHQQGDLPPQLPAPVIGLDALPRLVDEARQAGLQVYPVIMVKDAEQAPDALSRASYRVVQEALTNASKHGGAGPVLVELRAEPVQGVQITVRNPLRPAGAAPSSSGSRQGLTGINERAKLLGGTASWREQDGQFVLTVFLPWLPESPR